MAYSKEFQQLISSPDAFAEIMKHNCSGPNYAMWEAKRRFITQSIDSDGTILDIGCAGGMLLKCLQEWGGLQLEPFGVDLVPEFVSAAKKLFPDKQDNFAVLDVSNINELPNQLAKVGLPTNYDYVYWNFLGTKYFKSPNISELINSMLSLAGKRTIIGFYAANRFVHGSSGWQQERDQITKRVNDFKSIWPVNGTLFNPTKFNQAIVWIDK